MSVGKIPNKQNRFRASRISSGVLPKAKPIEISRLKEIDEVSFYIYSSKGTTAEVCLKIRQENNSLIFGISYKFNNANKGIRLQFDQAEAAILVNQLQKMERSVVYYAWDKVKDGKISFSLMRYADSVKNVSVGEVARVIGQITIYEESGSGKYINFNVTQNVLYQICQLLS